jgi:hypothetical protein
MPKYEVELSGSVVVDAPSEVDAEDLAMNLIHGDISVWANTEAEIEFDVNAVKEID